MRHLDTLIVTGARTLIGACITASTVAVQLGVVFLVIAVAAAAGLAILT